MGLPMGPGEPRCPPGSSSAALQKFSSERSVGRSVGLIGLIGVTRKFAMKINKINVFISIYVYFSFFFKKKKYFYMFNKIVLLCIKK